MQTWTTSDGYVDLEAFIHADGDLNHDPRVEQAYAHGECGWHLKEELVLPIIGPIVEDEVVQSEQDEHHGEDVEEH